MTDPTGTVPRQENEVHVTPEPNDPEHRLDGFCWCQPIAEVEIGGVLYIHRRTLDSPHYEKDDTA